MMTEEGKLLYEQALEASQDLSEKLFDFLLMSMHKLKLN